MKRFMLVLLIFILLPSCVFAADDKDKYDDYLSAYDFSFFNENLDGETRDYLRELGLSEFDYENISSLTFSEVVKVILSVLKGSASVPLKNALSVVFFILLSALIQSMKNDTDTVLSGSFATASALIVSVLIIAGCSSTVSLCCASLGVAGNFIYAFIPVFCAIVLAGGAPVTAFSTNAMLLMLAQGISFLSSHLFMPLVNCFLALGICSGIRAELRLERLITTLKTVIIWGVSFIAGSFVSVLSIKTAVSGRADILGIRSARFVINSVVPVIGGAISEGLLSIQSYSSLIKSSVGIVGIIAVALVFLPAVLQVMMWRAALSVCAITADIFDDRSVSCVLSAFKDTMLLMNVVLILSAMCTVISIGLLIAAGG
ncbi:MAG: hypothetical protein E7520_06795 [Ruminococcaceae bacterium]|nr:hypothetical protein [Oscillospiraceae bacterium]